MNHLIELGDKLTEEIQSICDGNVFELVSQKGRHSLPIVVWKLCTQTHYDGKSNVFGIPRCRADNMSSRI
jgi:hypothetical protein